MADMSPSRSSMKERKMDAPVRNSNFDHASVCNKLTSFSHIKLQFSGLRKIILTIYLIIVILFVVMMILIAIFAPIEEAIKSLQNSNESGN